MSMNILITGAGGFIGQALVKDLLSDPVLSSLTLTDVIKPPVPITRNPNFHFGYKYTYTTVTKVSAPYIKELK
jgi:nucleoside-diphosphate-sugar epimerase